MESSWRQNVPNFNMAGSDWELCARLPGSILESVYLVKRDKAPAKQWFYLILSGDLPVLIGSTPVLPGDGNFPWGNEVDPD